MDSLSIIVPTYNAARYLPDLLVELAEFETAEVIFIDDGSSDETVALLQSFAKRHADVVIKTKNHTGVSDSRNLGIELATGKYVMFIDADDLFGTGSVPVVLDELKQDTDVIYFTKTADAYYDYDLDESIRERFEAKILGVEQHPVEDFQINPGPYSRLFRTDLLKQKGIRFESDVYLGEDSLFNIAVVAQAQTARVVPAGVYRYRQHEQSASRQLKFDLVASSDAYFVALERLLGAGVLLRQKAGLSLFNDRRRLLLTKAPRTELRRLAQHGKARQPDYSAVSAKQRFINTLVDMGLIHVARAILQKINHPVTDENFIEL